MLWNQTEGCIQKSVVYYKNSNVDSSSFTSASFNTVPVYEYVLPVGANCASLPSKISCGYGSVCINDVCTVSTSQQPKYLTTPN